MDDFRCDERDAQRDDRLDGRPGQVDEAKRRAGKCETVGERECGDGCDQATHAGHQNQQRKNEQKVVDAAQDVLDAEQEVGSSHFKPARLGRNREGWTACGQAMRLVDAIGEVEPDQYVCRGLVEPVDMD